MKLRNKLATLLTPKDVADMANVSPKTVTRWRRDGLLAGIKIGTLVRFRPEDVETFFNRHRQ